MRNCDHCGREQRGYAHLYREGKNHALCHPDEGLDCYRLVTMYGEPLGIRKLAAWVFSIDWSDIKTVKTHLPFEELE